MSKTETGSRNIRALFIFAWNEILMFCVSGDNPADQFIWMNREHLCVLVYLVTVMHSMQVSAHIHTLGRW